MGAWLGLAVLVTVLGAAAVAAAPVPAELGPCPPIESFCDTIALVCQTARALGLDLPLCHLV